MRQNRGFCLVCLVRSCEGPNDVIFTIFGQRQVSKWNCNSPRMLADAGRSSVRDSARKEKFYFKISRSHSRETYLLLQNCLPARFEDARSERNTSSAKWPGQIFGFGPGSLGRARAARVKIGSER